VFTGDEIEAGERKGREEVTRLAEAGGDGFKG
jgi:hypothetical protein